MNKMLISVFVSVSVDTVDGYADRRFPEKMAQGGGHLTKMHCILYNGINSDFMAL